MEVFLLILRLGLAGVFGLAGITKLVDREGTEKAVADFGVPAALIRPVAVLLPVAELAIAAALFPIVSSWFAAIAAAAMFVVFTAAMLYHIAQGRSPDCHCFGQVYSEPVGVSSVLRNIGFLAAASGLVVAGQGSQGYDLLNGEGSVMQLVLGLTLIALAGIAILYLRKISEQQTQLIRRIEVMELVAREGGSVEREDVSHPQDGLPIGGYFPDFELYDLNANLISSKQIKAQGVPTLFFFVSPTCGPCKALLPEINEWRKELMGKVNFVFISSGKAPDNIEKFGLDPRLPVLLQKGREVAESVKAQWTPTAILMDGNGRVASHATAGDTQIRALVEKIKGQDLTAKFAYVANGNGNGHGHDHNHNKIGEPIPEFRIEDIKGRVIDSDYFKGKQTLVAFWSLTCQFCTKMMEELQEWDKTKGKDAPELVLFSEGDRDAHEKFGLKSPIILEEGYKTAAGFGMFGTPSAVLVDEDGTIVSETAVGAQNIWSLVGKGS